ncbi:hypothetical protein EXIGLDRAFT_836371 [Exidia glandulosa HHB12029]|uniref:Uncharacterized protein n=1 Tax=Exidia glandulosa HHB12029 TaxID=1314781 RepID=A0A165HWZ3_EXIGL|nr:hypothetical protein EXIGLDRAFT_836371 [Exidia glandulosa HHB12029]
MLQTSIYRIVFNVLALVPGVAFLPLVVATIVFGKGAVKRGPIYLNFIIATALLGLSFGLLGLAGQQDQLQPKSRTLCYIQTVLVDGTLGMTPVSILALVLQLGLGLYNLRDPAAGSRWAPLRNVVFITTPYIAFLTFAVRDIIFITEIQAGSDEYDVVNPAFYCMLSALNTPLAPLSFIENPLVLFIAAVSCITLLVECFIAYLLWREWNGLRTASKDGSEAGPVRVPVGALIRLVVFTVYRIAVIVIAIYVVQDPKMFPIAEFFHGTIPLVVFLIFGLQRDIVGTWLGWFKCSTYTSTGPIAVKVTREQAKYEDA